MISMIEKKYANEVQQWVMSCLNRVLKPIHTDYQAAPETLRI